MKDWYPLTAADVRGVTFALVCAKADTAKA
jgi:hypothetical protein